MYIEINTQNGMICNWRCLETLAQDCEKLAEIITWYIDDMNNKNVFKNGKNGKRLISITVDGDTYVVNKAFLESNTKPRAK